MNVSRWQLVGLVFAGVISAGSAMAAGRRAPELKVTLDQPTEFCNSYGCFTVKGDVTLFNMNPRQLAEGTLEKRASIKGVEIQSRTRVTFVVEAENHFLPRTQCGGAGVINYGSTISVAGVPMAPKGLCLVHPDQHNPLREEGTLEVNGNLYTPTTVGGIEYSADHAIRFVTDIRESLEKPRVVMMNGRVFSERRVRIGATAVDVFPADEIRNSPYEFAIITHSGRARNLPFGHVGVSATFDPVSGQLRDFTPAPGSVIQGVYLEPNTTVDVYADGQIKMVQAKRYTVQQVQGINVGTVTGYSEAERVYFWPNGNIQFTTAHSDIGGNVQIDRNVWHRGTVAQLGMSPSGRVVYRNLSHVNGEGDRAEAMDASGDFRTLSKEERDALKINWFPDQALLDFLATYR